MTDLHEVATEARRLTHAVRPNWLTETCCAFVDPTARVNPATTKVWHFARVLHYAVVGDHCVIGSGAEVGSFSTLGDRTHLGANVFLPPNSVVGSDVFIGPGVICTDDRHPKAGNADYIAEPPIIEDGASIGAGAVLLPGVRIGAGAIIGAGAVISKDVPPHTVIRGERASIERPVTQAVMRAVA